jgi:DNA repair protein RadC
MSVVDLARNLLNDYGSLTALAQASADELSRIRGMGRVKAQVLKSALELSKRLADESTPTRQAIRSPEDAAGVLRERIKTREEESFWVLLLDAKNRLIKAPFEVTRGLLDASLVHPREVFKEAIRSASAAVVLAHNHPSGDPTPSSEDIRITKQLVEAGQIVDIHVLDHVVLGRSSEGNSGDFFSLRESGVVDFRPRIEKT